MDPERREHLRQTLRPAGIDEAALTDEQVDDRVRRMLHQALESEDGAGVGTVGTDFSPAADLTHWAWHDRALASLRAGLQRVETRASGLMRFGEAWTAVAAWGRERFALADRDAPAAEWTDETEVMVFWHEPSRYPDRFTYSNPGPPEELGEPVFVVEVGRSLTVDDEERRIGHGGWSAGADLYLEATDHLERRVSALPGFLGRGAYFPAFNYYSDSAKLGEHEGDDFFRAVWSLPLLGFNAS